MKKQNLSTTAKSIQRMLLACTLMLLPTMASAQCPDNNHPHMIDLGLPSGTKWACCNVGASKPEDYGGFYAWGETEENVWTTTWDYDKQKYIDIGADIACTEHDVAHVKWGGSWQMPSLDQLNELVNWSSYEWTKENNIEGVRFTSIVNGNSIFLPSKWSVFHEKGTLSEDEDVWEGMIQIWSSTLNENQYDESGYSEAYLLDYRQFYGPFIYSDSRMSGVNQSENVRPVSVSSPSGIIIDENTFPDDNFRDWVLAQEYGQDGVLTEEEIDGVTRIEVLFQDIADLKGIEYFTALTSLESYGNQLSSLDVSKNTALKYLSCGGNQLTSLDVSQNTALEVLYCCINQLTSLDVSQNTALKDLFCYDNQLTSLDVSQNTALDVLFCYSNRIKVTEMGKLVESLPTNNGYLYVKNLNDANEQNVITTTLVTAAKAKGWKVRAINDNENWVEYDGEEQQEITPVEQGEVINIGNEIDEDTNLDGNVVDNVYFNINDGSYDASGGCIVVNSPTDDSFINGQDIFGDDFKEGYNGIVFMVPAGEGTIYVEAETTGNMVLKVKIGNKKPITMVLNGKLTISFPYDVTEDTYVYIYGGTNSAGAKGMKKASGSGSLKIYGIEVVSGSDGIEAIDNGQLTIDNSPMYNLNGQRVISSPSGRPGGVPTKGVFIKNGKKVLVK